MFKNLLALSLISITLVGCGNSKEAVYDKCLAQANQTFAINTNTLVEKAYFFRNCMSEHGYRFKDKDDCISNVVEEMSAICYLKEN